MKKLLVAVAATVTVGIASAQTADQIIAAHIDSIGGKANIDKIKNVVIAGAFTVQGMPIEVTITKVQNKLSRKDISAMGMKGYDLATDTSGWVFMPIQGMATPVQKSADDVKDEKAELDIAGPLNDYAAKGLKAEFSGKDTIDGKAAYKIKLATASGKEKTYFIDATSYLIVREVDKIEFNGQKMDVSVDYGDYRIVDGVKFPYSISQQFGTINISSVKVNGKIEDKLYRNQ